jgi:hypothetical protein
VHPEWPGEQFTPEVGEENPQTFHWRHRSGVRVITGDTPTKAIAVRALAKTAGKYLSNRVVQAVIKRFGKNGELENVGKRAVIHLPALILQNAAK